MVLVVLQALVSLAVALERWSDDPPPSVVGAVTDPPGDAAPGGPDADAGQPPGIDLTSASVIRLNGMLTFTATTTEERGDHDRTWVLRLWKPNGRLLYMLYAGDMPVGGQNVFLCQHDDWCSDRARGAFTESAPPKTVRIRVPLERLSKLPDTFEWEASVSSSPTANIDDTWNDFAPRSGVHRMPGE